MRRHADRAAGAGEAVRTRDDVDRRAVRLAARRKVLRPTTPLLVVGALVGATGLVLAGSAGLVRSAVLVGDQEAAGRAVEVVAALGGWVEPWKAVFAEGTVAAAAATDLTGLARAEALLREALEITPDDGACMVRYNLGRVLVATGEAHASDPEAAVRWFDEAERVAREAPSGCDVVLGLADAREDPAGHRPSDGTQEGMAGEGTTDGDSPGGEEGGGSSSASDELGSLADSAAEASRAASAQGVPAPGAPSPAPAEQEPSDPDGHDEARRQELESRSVRSMEEQSLHEESRGAGPEDQAARVARPW